MSRLLEWLRSLYRAMAENAPDWIDSTIDGRRT